MAARNAGLPAKSSFPLKPPLKWAGGKRWLLPHLKPYWEQHSRRRMVEPFCGGLSVTLGLMPEHALLNDINPHLINFFKWLQQGLVLESPLKNERDLYYTLRERFNEYIAQEKAETKRAAEIFYYLNRTGYNGLCRFNRKGEYNVPFGRYKRINYIQDFRGYMEPFRDWVFMSTDFAAIPVDDQDFIYADPPYDVEFTQYAKEGFTWEDQVRLAGWLAAHPGPVILSNQATARIINLYRHYDFTMELLDAPRMISCTGDRTPAKEVLAIKNLGVCK